MQDFTDDQRNQIEFLKQQIATLQRFMQDKDAQMNGALESFNKLKNKLDYDFLQLRQKYEQLYLRNQASEMQKNKLLEDAKLKHQGLEQRIRDVTLSLTSQLDVLRETIQRLKSAIDVKDKEIEGYLQ